MIQKFRYKFIAMSTTALLVVIMTIVGSICGLTYYHARQEINNVLTILVDNEGQLPSGGQTKHYPQPQYTREGLQQYRYFSVTFDRADQLTSVEDDHITSIGPQTAKRLAQRAVKRNLKNGQLRYQGVTYAYRVRKQKKATTVVFLDESLLMARTTELMHTGTLLGVIVLLLYALILTLYSRRAIRPIIQAEHRQKQFITNASHELKTPLTVIAANTEMQELLGGENEWTKSTRQQVDRLTKLINNLVSLARMQEQPDITMAPVDISKLAEDVSQSFSSVAKSGDKQFVTKIAPNLVVTGDENLLRELFNILLDNANKYCDPQGTIQLTVQPAKHTKNAVITVANTYKEGENEDYHRFFERFYRADESHTKNGKSGFGIGLSMAQYLIKLMKGKISAKYADHSLAFAITLKQSEK